MPKYLSPDFADEKFILAPDVITEEVLSDGIAPENYHSTSMYPEYFTI